MGELNIQAIVAQKVAHYIAEAIPEEEWDKMVRGQIYELITGSRRRELENRIKEALDERIKKMIRTQVADADYWGSTWGDPAGIFKEVVAEHADKIIEKMFESVFTKMAYAMKQAIGAV